MTDNPEARLILEYCPEMLEACGTPPAELLKLLQDLGFKPYTPRQRAEPAPMSWAEVSQTGYVDLLLSRQPLPALAA